MQTSPDKEPPPKTPSPDKPFRLYAAVSVGPAIRTFREQAGLTQERLAELADLNRTYLSDLEQGKETEQLRRILRLLKLLGVRATLQKADRVTSERILNEAVKWGMRRPQAESIVTDALHGLPDEVAAAADEAPGLPDALVALVNQRVDRLVRGMNRAAE